MNVVQADVKVFFNSSLSEKRLEPSSPASLIVLANGLSGKHSGRTIASLS